jgi:hypothetical protein
MFGDSAGLNPGGEGFVFPLLLRIIVSAAVSLGNRVLRVAKIGYRLPRWYFA